MGRGRQAGRTVVVVAAIDILFLATVIAVFMFCNQCCT